LWSTSITSSSWLNILTTTLDLLWKVTKLGMNRTRRICLHHRSNSFLMGWAGYPPQWEKANMGLTSHHHWYSCWSKRDNYDSPWWSVPWFVGRNGVMGWGEGETGLARCHAPNMAAVCWVDELGISCLSSCKALLV
jgi:hypothetical protein